MTSDEAIQSLRKVADSMEAGHPDRELAWKLTAWMVGWVTGASDDTIFAPDVVNRVGRLISDAPYEGP